MAHLNISMEEVLILIERNADYDKKKVRKLRAINDREIEITVGIGFLPSIKVILMFNKFEKGKIYFTLNSNEGIINMFMGFLKKTDSEDYIYIHNKIVIVKANKFLLKRFSGVQIEGLKIANKEVNVKFYISNNIYE